VAYNLMDQDPKNPKSKVQEVKLNSLSNDSGFISDFKLFLEENSNLVIGVSIGTLLVVFGLFFGLTSNQETSNENSLQEVAELATGALMNDSGTTSPTQNELAAPPSLQFNSGESNNSSSSETGNNTNSSTSTSNDLEIGPPTIGAATDNGGGTTTTVESNDTLSSQNQTGSPFGSTSTGSGQGIGNLSNQVPNPNVSLGQNPNNPNGFLSNTQSQVLNSNSVQGNTGPEIYFALGFSIFAAYIYRYRLKKRI